jgi:hypothetical protein
MTDTMTSQNIDLSSGRNYIQLLRINTLHDPDTSTLKFKLNVTFVVLMGVIICWNEMTCRRHKFKDLYEEGAAFIFKIKA